MNRASNLKWLAAALLVAMVAAPVEARTYLGFTLGVGGAPPPPRVVIVDRQPDLVVVPRTSVYVVQNSDYDVFRYGRTYYVYNDGYWYRSRTYGGPFVVVDVRSVPRPVLTLPDDRWKHHPHGGPPGQMKKRGRGWH